METVPVTIGPPPDPSLEDLVYRIGPYDRLQVEVFGVEEMSSTGRVNFQGFYTMPLVGSISLNGLTTDEAEAEIERVLGSRYLRNPSVTVYVEDTANMNITLSGKMNGSRQITGRTTLGQVLAASGGVPPVGKKRQVVIFRATDETRQTANPSLHAYVVDYQAILEGKLRDPLLVGNDRVYVPPSALAIFFDPWLGVFKTYTPVEIDKPTIF
ncbi:MAG: polysaccharide biosynthesis/export family protein [Thiocapsa sp.]|uniref:polysaccharide biosynthesis/export family protein n=1 Tax=Thiocapsa sp. TaxID=2024551 RepID=UPI001BCF2CAB|nr:polysaccharide biosynthesis/export family protein [Thiocapsa sp.]QVL50064.1 MAG: polysaccharide biosynthesis/export family protein [Thiocapsa sp.]